MRTVLVLIMMVFSMPAKAEILRAYNVKLKADSVNQARTGNIEEKIYAEAIKGNYSYVADGISCEKLRYLIVKGYDLEKYNKSCFITWY